MARHEKRNLIARDPKIARAPSGAPFAALLGGGPRFTLECYAHREHGERKSKAVSQLLAGPRSGPGRSPGTARVLMLRFMSPRAPHLAPPHDAS